MTNAPLPGARTPIAGNLPASPAFYRFLASLQSLQAANPDSADITAINAELAALSSEIHALQESGGGDPALAVAFPLTMQGLLQNGYAKLLWSGTTDDVPEGSNLYYTNARAYAAAKARLLAGDGVTITPDDGAETLTLAASGNVASIARSWVVA